MREQRRLTRYHAVAHLANEDASGESVGDAVNVAARVAESLG